MEGAQAAKCPRGRFTRALLNRRDVGCRELVRPLKLIARLLKLNAPTTPLQADGLSCRVYPFLGLAIVGLVSLHGYAGVIASPVLAGAAAIGIILVLAPLAPI